MIVLDHGTPVARADGHRHRRRRHVVPAALALACAVGVAACGGGQTVRDAGPRTFTDTSGVQVQVPADVEKVGEQFPAHTVTTIMLGDGAKLAAIPPNVRTLPFLKKVYPQIASVPELFQADGSVNVEELFNAKVDVVFAFDGGAPLAPFKSAGMPAVTVGFASYDQLAQSVTLAGDIYGGDAVKRAKAYVDYLHRNVDLVTSRLANLPDSSLPTVLHISAYPPISVDGAGGSTDLWIRVAGAKNAVADVKGRGTITPEQLLRLDPDVIILQAPGGDQGLVAGSGQAVLDQLATLPGWNDLKAVKNHRVIINPQGMYPWERASPEAALQVLFAAKALHPDLFQDIDMRTEARNFYRDMFDYTPTDQELDAIFQQTS